MATFHPLRSFQHDSAATSKSQAESWSRLAFNHILQCSGIIYQLKFSPSKQHSFFASAGSTRLQTHHQFKGTILKTFSQFKQTCHCCDVRSDGLLLAGAGIEGRVRIFDHANGYKLRDIHCHTQSVFGIGFTQDNKMIASCSDDKTLKVHDISDSSLVHTFQGFADYARSLSIVKEHCSLVVCGSYDHGVSLIDLRSGNSSVPVRKFDHGAPIDSVETFPRGTILASAGGETVKVWDTRMSYEHPLATMRSHHKNVVCLALTSAADRLVSGGLDKKVKFYETQTFAEVHSIEYSDPVLSLAISPDDQTIVAGTTAGFIHIKSKPEPEANKRMHSLWEVGKKSARTISHGEPTKRGLDETVIFEKPLGMKQFDLHLKKFQHSKALKQALNNFSRPHVVYHMVCELERRRRLETASTGLTISDLKRVLIFLRKYITNPHYSGAFGHWFSILTRIYGNNLLRLPELSQPFRNVSIAISSELETIKQLFELSGCVDALDCQAQDYYQHMTQPLTIQPPTLTQPPLDGDVNCQ